MAGTANGDSDLLRVCLSGGIRRIGTHSSPEATEQDGASRPQGARRAADPAQVATIRSSLPVYIAVGEADPVNGGLALLNPLTQRYKAAGLADVTIRTYPGARHEILNETNREEVIAELNRWLDRVVTGSGHGG